MAFRTPRVRALGILAAGLVLVTVTALVTNAPRGSPAAEPTPTASPPSSPPAVIDEIVASVVTDDADALQRRFAGVTARAGQIVGGPVGIYGPAEVTTSEWTSLLGPARRSLHALVKDPREPFPWWDQPPLPTPRAAVLAAPRDFDVVLIVESSDGRKHPWRFSVASDRVIDVVIDRGVDPSGFDRPLVRKLGYLTPSPDDEPGMFLVLPPQEMRPPPVGLGIGPGWPGGPPAPVRAPSLAPDGRTGEPAIDRIVDQLVSADAATLLSTYPELAARQQACDPSCDDVRVPPAVWTSRLAAGRRSLYAVFTGDPADALIVLAVDGGGPVAEGWRFAVRAGRPAQVDIFVPSLDRTGPLPPFLYGAAAHTPAPARDYERFYVLPPQGELPRAPRTHAMSARTGDAGVDALLATLEARDAAKLLSAFADPEKLLVRKCYGTESTQDRAYAESWSRTVAGQLYGLHSVVRLPAGYQPTADHLVIAIRQMKPYWWDGVGILERAGKIVGVVTDDGACAPQMMYPPAGYLVPPPRGGELDASRRSGIGMIDAILDAAAARDEKAMAGLIDYSKRACGDGGGPPGTNPPQCPSGSRPGTLVDILPWIVCEGGFATRETAASSLVREVGPDAGASLYAVLPAPTDPRATMPPSPPFAMAVLVWKRGDVMTLAVGEHGVSSVGRTCGPSNPGTAIHAGQPTFLLSPP